MKFSAIILYSAVLLSFSSCTLNKNTPATVSQGISGHVTYSEGNMMPGPGMTNSGKGVQRTIMIYSLASVAEAKGEAPLYQSVGTQLIATVKSDTAGYYKCSLKPGRYSVFTEEEGKKLFSGLSNDKAELSPVEVLPGKVAVYDIMVNYKAVY
jgi:hypothetical protein